MTSTLRAPLRLSAGRDGAAAAAVAGRRDRRERGGGQERERDGPQAMHHGAPIMPPARARGP